MAEEKSFLFIQYKCPILFLFFLEKTLNPQKITPVLFVCITVILFYLWHLTGTLYFINYTIRKRQTHKKSSNNNTLHFPLKVSKPLISLMMPLYLFRTQMFSKHFQICLLYLTRRCYAMWIISGRFTLKEH